MQSRSRLGQDRLARHLMGLVTLLVGLLLPLIAVVLFVRSQPILAAKPLGELLFSTEWRPASGEFGFLPFIVGTLWVTIVSMLVAVPLSLLTAVYLVEYRPARDLQMDQAAHRPAGRHSVGDLWRVGGPDDCAVRAAGRTGHEPVAGLHSPDRAPCFRATTRPATVSWPEAWSWR